MTGIQTFVLVMLLHSSSLAIPGYGSMAECEKAGEIAIQRKLANKVFCVPGPVEVK